MVATLLLLTVALGSDPSAADWGGFRGLEKQGAAPSSIPILSWSANDAIRWQTQITGDGYSSPAVAEGRVYVTTAFFAPMGEVRRHIVACVSFALTAFIAIHVIGTIARGCSRAPCGAHPWRGLLGVAIVGLIATMLAFLILFGAIVLDFDRCPIRTWLGSAMVASLCILLCGFDVRTSSVERLIVGIASVCLGVLVAAGVPCKEQFLDGRVGLDFSILMAVYEGMIVLKRREIELAMPAAEEISGRNAEEQVTSQAIPSDRTSLELVKR